MVPLAWLVHSSIFSRSALISNDCGCAEVHQRHSIEMIIGKLSCEERGTTLTYCGNTWPHRTSNRYSACLV